MSTSPDAPTPPLASTPEPPDRPRAVAVRLGAERFYVRLADGREVGVPYAWYYRLADATEAERAGWELIAGGTGIHWEAIDEDLSVAGLLAGRRGPRRPGERAAAAPAPVLVGR